MKICQKLLAVLLSVVLAFSAFAFGACAQETPKTQKLLETLNSGNAVSVTLKAGDTLLGSSNDTFIIKGSALAYEYGTGFFSIRLLLNDGALYAYLPFFPFLYVKVPTLALGLGDGDVWKLIETVTGATFSILRYVKSYTETIDGVSYDVEEYFDNAQVTVKFCYQDDTLKLLNVTDAQTKSVQNTYFQNISFDVPDALVAVPQGIDLTFLFKGLVTALMGSTVLA